MDQLRGKAAAITGAGSGIGRALALAFAAEGMNVAVGDIEAAKADETAQECTKHGVRACAAAVDVADRDGVEAFAEAVYENLGSCDLLCNNAGIVAVGRAQELKDSDWDWTLDVDLWGVINGLLAFLPRMVAAKRGGHIVNTASIAGMVSHAAPGLIAYNTAKYGVVGLSESLALDLAPENIGVSVLCPDGVRTNIGSSGRNRPERFGGPTAPRLQPEGAAIRLPADRVVLAPETVAAFVVRAVKDNQLYVMTHPATRGWLEGRLAAIRADYEWGLAELKR
jgi:NAD(P)-dependent dehydrogenase (short-subunit alcohol dehydrogenase family)